jgi:hypothetical protein
MVETGEQLVAGGVVAASDAAETAKGSGGAEAGAGVGCRLDVTGQLALEDGFGEALTKRLLPDDALAALHELSQGALREIDRLASAALGEPPAARKSSSTATSSPASASHS